MRIYLYIPAFIACHALALAQAPAPPASDDPESLAFFEREIRPLLLDRCGKCHGADKPKGGLSITAREHLLAGGDQGPAIVPGNADESLLVEAVRYGDLLKMPPKAKLANQEIQAIERWINLGAPWPGNPHTNPAPSNSADNFDLDARANHWSFQPLQDPPIPAVQDRDWPANPIDHFILAKLEQLHLKPSPPADRATLLRRLTLDLTGLPPTLEQRAAFLADARPDAYQHVLDQLLASPHHGERWARHWLDLVRYVETYGHEFDYDIPFAWRYRDYVIRATNADLPFDQFAREHIAGDLIQPPRVEPAPLSNESILATAFFWFGDGTHSPVDVREEQLKRFDNQIDVLGKSFLGLTIACARCHDHKFDPIRQRDYYALAGFLKSARYSLVPTTTNPDQAAIAAALRENSRALAQASLDTPAQSTPNTSPTNPTTPFETFNQPNFQTWTSTGLAFGSAPSQAGDAHLNKHNALSPVPPGIAHSALAAEPLQGILRSQTFTIDHQFIQYRAAGSGAQIQVVVDGFEKNRDPIYGALVIAVNHGDTLRWINQDVSHWRGRRAYIELIDGGASSFSGATTAITPADGFIAVDEIRFADSPTPPDTPTAQPVYTNPAGKSAETNRLLAARNTLISKIEAPHFALAISEGTPENESLLIRGNARNASDPVPRRFLETLQHNTNPTPTRLELAHQFTARDNPLFARVAVNRIWLHHFGRGLVPTPDDFGHMGQPPTHPELLDWLASEFIRSGYSAKHIHRLILTSRAYQQSSATKPEAATIDPDNQWLHRANVRRLEAESIRDTILAVSGQLRPTLYGPSTPPFLSEFMEGRGRPATSGPLDGNARRSIYLNMRRNFLPPLLLAFDLPTPSTTIGRRNNSNVPAQALALLNDPFVLDQARLWADHLLAIPNLSETDRLETLYLQAFARPPSPDEQAQALKIIQSQTNPWPTLCHILFNLKEFIFIP